MKSPKDMRIILIDITNACVHQCSNCTRFCGHHKKPFFMDYETFCRAVDSLDGFPGTVGMIGGESTLHPDFERMARYLAEKRPGKTDFSLYRPQKNFYDAVHDVEMSHTYVMDTGCEERRLVKGGGVWSVMGDAYKKHYEIIQDMAQYQALNDHSNPMYHKPALISRKDLDIPDEQWKVMRDNCWVVDVWSANITPKGAFFCEVAGCLDMLFDGPGGVPIEPGWWKRDPEEFGDQLNWCEICGMALDTFTRDANEEIDDVSPLLYEKLKKIGSRKIKNGRVNLIQINEGVIAEESKAAGKVFKSDMPYVERYSDRFDAEKTSLYYKEYAGVFECGNREELENCIAVSSSFREINVLAGKALLNDIKTEDFSCEVHVFQKESFDTGYVLYHALEKKDHNLFVFYAKGNVKIKAALSRLKEQVLNPGTLLYSKFTEDTESSYFKAAKGSEVMLINPVAISLREIGGDRLLGMKTVCEIRDAWQEKKVFSFDQSTEGSVPITAIVPGKRYIVYGAGRKLEDAIEYITSQGGSVTGVADPNEILQGRYICGFYVKTPDELRYCRNDFDKVMMVVGPYYKEAKDFLLSIGISAEDMAWI